jgi:hypothetical protein
MLARSIRNDDDGYGMEIMAHVLYAGLESAAPYWWDREIVETLGEAAKTLPSSKLSPSDVPLRLGWLYFEKETPVELPSGKPMNIKAILWVAGSENLDGEEHVTVRAVAEHNLLLGDEHGVALVFFSRMPDGRLLPCLCSTWQFGFDIEERDPEVIKDVSHEERDVDALSQRGLSLFLSAMLFLQQKCVVNGVQALPRDARRRVEHRKTANVVQPVNVVYLRKPKHQASGNHADVDWDHRWWVGPHWAIRWCGPGRREERRVLIMPYTKGPDDKPLHPPKKNLYAVVR